MYKKIRTLLTLLLVPAMGAFSQNMPLVNVPSPEVAGLGEYGTVPVGLYTGVPDISVPLHEMKAGKQSLPITASYHLSLVKPHTQEGSLGMGWSLQAGGYISRSVNAVCDEKMHADGYAPGFYAHAYRLKGMTYQQFADATKNIRSAGGADTYYELSADEFSFSFFGYSGTFHYNENSGWTVISDQDIRLEFNPADGEGFIKLAGLRPQIKPNGWGGKNYNNRFFNKFTLVTPDGCRYEFGGTSATEYSISYYDRNNSDLIATTWQLSKIVTPDKRVITYSYEATDLLCDLKYMPQSKKVYNAPCSASNPSMGRNAMTGFLIMPVRLASIVTPDEEISLAYFSEQNYSERFWATALGWNDNNFTPVDIYNPARQFERQQFSCFMNTALDYTTSITLQNSIKRNLRHSVLHRISIQSRYDIAHARSIYFGYSFNTRRKLSTIASREGIPALIPDYVWAPESPILTGYKIPAALTPDKAPEYKFAYNTANPIPYDYTAAETDYWGHYVGSNVSFSAIPQFEKPAPSLIYGQSDLLTEVTYPTGGKTRFEYEQNRYSKVTDVTHTKLNAQLGTAGGLRVSAVSRHDRNGLLLDKKKYFYAENRTAGSASSGILKEEPVYMITYIASGNVILEQKSQGGYLAPVTNQNSPVVGYSCVIEELQNAAGQSQGYIKRRYSNYDTDIHGNAHFDEPAVYSTASGESPVKPFTSRSVERGKLLSEETYDNNGRLLKQSFQHYKAVNAGEFKTAHQMLIFFCSDLDSHLGTCVGMLTRVYTHSYLPDSIVVIEYPSEGTGLGYSTKRILTYDNHKLLKQEKTVNSKGEAGTVSYTYPADRDNYQWMVNAHQLSPVIEKTASEDGRSLKETREYDYRDAGYGPIPYIKSVSRMFDGAGSRTDYQVQTTDVYANPVATLTCGVTDVCLWSYKGQRLIARIENADYNQVKRLLAQSPENLSTSMQPDNATYRLIEGIRHKLPKSRVFIYKYTSGMQIESVTSPDGQTLFYKYDYLDRLREEYLYENPSGHRQKKLLRVYDYHYQH